MLRAKKNIKTASNIMNRFTLDFHVMTYNCRNIMSFVKNVTTFATNVFQLTTSQVKIRAFKLAFKFPIVFA